jgi:hypothetical protein
MPRGKPRGKTVVINSIISEMEKLKKIFQAKDKMPELKDVFDREISKSLTRVNRVISSLTPKKVVKRKRAKKRTAKTARKKRAKKPAATPSGGA